MEYLDTIKEFKQFFKTHEIVSRDFYNKYADEKCWAVFRPELIECVLVVRRDILKTGLVCNDWVFGGKHHQRGYRENTCDICMEKTKSGIIYASPHPLGAALDLKSAKMSAEEMRQRIIECAYMLPHPVRLEKNVSWLHIDVCCLPSQKVKVYCFTA